MWRSRKQGVAGLGSSIPFLRPLSQLLRLVAIGTVAPPGLVALRTSARCLSKLAPFTAASSRAASTGGGSSGGIYGPPGRAPLPPQLPEDAGKLTVFLDMDETLVHRHVLTAHLCCPAAAQRS